MSSSDRFKLIFLLFCWKRCCLNPRDDTCASHRLFSQHLNKTKIFSWTPQGHFYFCQLIALKTSVTCEHFWRYRIKSVPDRINFKYCSKHSSWSSRSSSLWYKTINICNTVCQMVRASPLLKTKNFCCVFFKLWTKYKRGFWWEKLRFLKLSSQVLWVDSSYRASERQRHRRLKTPPIKMLVLKVYICLILIPSA